MLSKINFGNIKAPLLVLGMIFSSSQTLANLVCERSAGEPSHIEISEMKDNGKRKGFIWSKFYKLHRDTVVILSKKNPEEFNVEIILSAGDKAYGAAGKNSVTLLDYPQTDKGLGEPKWMKCRVPGLF